MNKRNRLMGGSMAIAPKGTAFMEKAEPLTREARELNVINEVDNSRCEVYQTNQTQMPGGDEDDIDEFPEIDIDVHLAL